MYRHRSRPKNLGAGPHGERGARAYNGGLRVVTKKVGVCAPGPNVDPPLIRYLLAILLRIFATMYTQRKRRVPEYRMTHPTNRMQATCAHVPLQLCKTGRCFNLTKLLKKKKKKYSSNSDDRRSRQFTIDQNVTICIQCG
jgi:hypothetical protein